MIRRGQPFDRKHFAAFHLPHQHQAGVHRLPIALGVRAQEVKNLADKTMCESYLKQAQYEERQGHWFEAARSWLKVAKIKNDEFVHVSTTRPIQPTLLFEDPLCPTCKAFHERFQPLTAAP